MRGTISHTALMQALFDDSAVGVSIVDRQFRMLATNAAMDEINGVTCGPDGLDPALALTDAFAAAHEHIQKVFDSGEAALAVELLCRTADGEPRVFWCDYLPVREDGALVAVAGLVRVAPKVHPRSLQALEATL